MKIKADELLYYAAKKRAKDYLISQGAPLTGNDIFASCKTNQVYLTVWDSKEEGVTGVSLRFNDFQWHTPDVRIYTDRYGYLDLERLAKKIPALRVKLEYSLRCERERQREQQLHEEMKLRWGNIDPSGVAASFQFDDPSTVKVTIALHDGEQELLEAFLANVQIARSATAEKE